MIFCRELNKSFDNHQMMFKEIIENRTYLSALKKSAIKFTDGFDCLLFDDATEKGIINKGNEAVIGNPSELKVRIVGNTTDLYDSHGDKHERDLWKRTLKSSSTRIHLQEHERSFDAVISNDAKVYTKDMSWKDLGAPYDGITQALLMDSLVTADRNEEMFKQYKNGWVNNHSVGMQYVDFAICINSEERWAAEEKANWDKYYPSIVNKEDVDKYGYFWAILEAKLIEVSAVLFGSNFITPTLENNMKSEQSPSNNKNDDPSNDTHQPINNFINPNLF